MLQSPPNRRFGEHDETDLAREIESFERDISKCEQQSSDLISNRSDQFEERVTLIFLENQKGLFHLSFPDADGAIDNFWSMSRNCMYRLTWNLESNFTRREKNHSLFH